MSVPTQIAARSVPFAISNDAGVTFKNVVCKKTWSWTGDTTLVQEETDCDTLTEVGATKVSFSAEFVLNTTPNGATEWGANDVAGFWANKTAIVVKLADGADFYRSISGYITNYQEQAPQGGMVTATITFNGTGTIDITA